MSNCKYYKQVKQVSYDDKQTWNNVVPAEYRKGELYEVDSPDCPLYERWKIVPGGYICECNSKYQKKILEISDDGVNYEIKYPVEYSKGDLIESDSSECIYKWYGNYYVGVSPTVIIKTDPIKVVLCENNSNILTSNDISYQNNYYITSGYVGSCVNSISGNIFSGNTVLESLDMSDSQISEISNYAFSGCTSLKNIYLPNTLNSIGYYAFDGCSDLTSIDIPDSVTSIGNYAFRYCYALTNITIPNSVTSFGTYIFQDCSGLTSANIQFNRSISNNTFYNCTSLTDVTIGSGVTSIGDSAFAYCSGLTSIDIPDSVTSIGSSAFNRCTNLTGVTIGSGVTSIYNSFTYCRNLSIIVIKATTPPTFISGNTSPFFHTIFSKIVVPDNSVDSYKTANVWKNYASKIIGISEYTGIKASFYKVDTYDNNNNVILCNSDSELKVTDFSDYYGSSSNNKVWNSLKIGECVTSIGNGAITQIPYTTFSAVTIGSNVTSIGDNAIGGWRPVTIYASTPPTLGVDAITGNSPIYVPSGSVNTYKSTTGWSEYADRIQPITPIYRWNNLTPTTSNTYYCSKPANKHYKQQKQVSFNEGITWQNVSPEEFKIGDVYEYNSVDCGYLTRIISGTPYCVGYNKYVDVYEQITYNNGCVWNTYSTSTTLLESNSVDCGYGLGYLTFIALEDGTFTFSGTTVYGVTNSLSYSLDSGTTWTALASNVASPTVSAGNTIMWKGELDSDYNYGVGHFSSTGNFSIKGNIMSILYGDNFVGEKSLENKYSVFNGLFKNNTKLISADNLFLPATTLEQNCYMFMFQGCTNLTSAPELPATTLVYQCYNYMFSNCTSLTTAPVLPATILETACYRGMFYGCTSLNHIKCLATDKTASDCTYSWLYNVSSTGTFVKNASMSSWPSGSSGIPSNWTVQNA